MTVTYSNQVTSSTGIGFLKLLVRWRGSIYKIVWFDLLVYLAVYYSLNLLYLYGLDEQTGRRYFVNIATYFSQHGTTIPLSFVLGFYVNVVYNRWWSQYCSIPYPDSIAILVGASVHGKDEKSRMIRRTIIRYVCVAFTLTLSMISPKVKKRFPTFHHFVRAGLLNNEEKSLMEDLDKEYPTHSSKYWLHLAWAANLATRARSEDIIHDDMGLKDILEQINEFREKCKKLYDYDWICIPLVYTQVVTLAVYLYFLFTVIGSQFIEGVAESETYIFKFPLMSCVEFFFYMGWLKVAESLINPFGEDEDDFDVVWMIDRHLQVGYLLVDKIYNECPRLRKDYHWNDMAPRQLPFTVASRKYMREHPTESTDKVCITREDQDLIFRDDLNMPEATGTILKSGRNLIRKLFLRQNPNPSYNLIRVALETGTKEHREEEWHEFNAYEGEETVQSAESSTLGVHVPNTDEFNSLINERLNERKKHLLRLLEVLIDDKEKATRLLNEIMK